ncbi:MAG: GWxTD domain-containing protein [Candidatus Krumholzibacteriota bacterium]|nr:GWxTD domain-containing protein [Candidatus Krumholzibacteriota bacterium]
MKQKNFIIAAAVILLSILTSNTAAAEDFDGENKLIERLAPFEKKIYYGLQYLFNKYQKKEFLSMESVAGRTKWRKKFWIYKDPTPTTEKNERKIEHEARVKLAGKLFGMEKPPGWDKRGETLIRFGMPSSRTKVPGEVGFYRMTPPGEIWYYKKLDMLIPFQNFNLNGVFIYAIEHYGESSRQTLDRLRRMKQFYNLRSIEELMFTRPEDVINVIEFNPDDIDYIADQDIRAKKARDLIAAIENRKMIKSKRNFYKYLQDNPTIYSFEVNQEKLPVYFDITKFKDGANSVETKINFEIPSSEIRFIKKEGELRGEVLLSALVRDINMKKVSSGHDTIRVAQPGLSKFSGPGHLPGQIVMSLNPGYYRIGLEAKDTSSDHRGVYNTTAQIDPMDNRLAMSDIQLASVIRKANNQTKFTRGGLQIIPHPLHAYRIPYPLTFYFEIYGLETNSDDLAFYSVDYKITPLGKRRKGPILEEVPTAISSKFERKGKGSKQIQRLEIATDNLWNGTFELTVSVMDRQTRETIHKRARFSVLE